MAIVYNISNAYFPVTVTLKQGVAPGGATVATNAHNFAGEYTFEDVASGTYCLAITDCFGCELTANVETIKYGLLYNHYAAIDVRKISSSDDFIVPTYAIWDAFNTFLGGESVAGGKLKRMGFVHWDSPNLGATNEYGFDLVGTGRRTNIGFEYKKAYSFLWGSDILIPVNAAIVSANWAQTKHELYGALFYQGCSIRLCNPTTLNPEGSVNTYTQNNGVVIPTIVINGIEWTVNISETKFRNGDWIAGYNSGVYTPISNSAWAALTTSALCAYEDNLDNI